jgi:hypothetical protein
MRIADLEYYNLSASALLTCLDCDYEWMLKYILKEKQTAPGRKFKMVFGSRNHEVEEKFQVCYADIGDKMLPEQFVKSATLEEIRERIVDIKRHLTYTHEWEYIQPTIRNMAHVDATRLVELMRYFDGDVKQALDYWKPIGSEIDQFTKGRIRVIVDRAIRVPPRFIAYKNKNDAVVIVDFKPGKLDKDGKPKMISEIADYDDRRLKKQLIFYAVNVENMPATPGYIGGMFYRTRQYLVEKISGTSVTNNKKNIDWFWNLEEFSRRHKGAWGADKCNWCGFRLTCRDTSDLARGLTDGEPVKLFTMCKIVKCVKCGKPFKIPKVDSDKECKACRYTKEEPKNAEYEELEA